MGAMRIRIGDYHPWASAANVQKAGWTVSDASLVRTLKSTVTFGINDPTRKLARPLRLQQLPYVVIKVANVAHAIIFAIAF